ncbi:MAG: hypothetical protein K2Q01_10440, partial [Rickettsiales bacterium]|nr:hypothetical protein [Rickettsiales bacterium]
YAEAEEKRYDRGDKGRDSWDDGKGDSYSSRFESQKGLSARERLSKGREASREEVADYRGM